ncbi:GtrA family protein [Cryobacterium glaciale]|uniref:GtrA family protein n=1 Tax=Cryobacterium glaciale TaxID=1259145 RepID=UPI00141AC969|nr:GtrA family protein [Cryobacterium glaciale]
MLELVRNRLNQSSVRQFLRFFVGSAVGLAIDLIGFQALISLGLSPWESNLISSSVSITAVYFVVTRFTFGVDTRFVTYGIFFGWYGLSVVGYSALIQTVSTGLGGDPFGWKLLSIPISFSLNYAFSRFLFLGRYKVRAGTPTEAQDAE